MIFESIWFQRPEGPNFLAEESYPPEVYLVEKEKNSPADFSRYLPLIARKSRFCSKKVGKVAPRENESDNFS